MTLTKEVLFSLFASFDDETPIMFEMEEKELFLQRDPGLLDGKVVCVLGSGGGIYDSGRKV